MKALRKYIIIFISLLLLSRPFALNSCGFFIAGEEYRFWLFQPDVGSSHTLMPFFFTTDLYYSSAGGPAYGLPPEEFDTTHANISEWYTHLKGQASKQHILQILYKTDPLLFLEMPDSLQQNSFIKTLQKPAYKDEKEYLHLAKLCEQLLPHTNPWWHYEFNNDEPAYDSLAYNRVEKQIAHLKEHSRSSFVRLRCAFQQMRIYIGVYPELKRLYEQEILPQAKGSWIADAALLMVATYTAEPQRTHILCELYRRCPEKRTRCVELFNRSHIKHLLQQAKNKEEQADMLQMYEMQNPGRSLANLERIYQLEPTAAALPLLLVREINKLEDWLLTPVLTDFDPASKNIFYSTPQQISNRQADEKYRLQYAAFLQKLVRDKKRSDLDFLHLASGYLAFLGKNLQEAKEHFQAAQALHPRDQRTRSQLALCQFMLQISAEKNWNQQSEKLFLHMINTLRQGKHYLQQEIYVRQLILFVSNLLLEKGETARGLLLRAHCERATGTFPDWGLKDIYQQILERASPEDMERMIILLNLGAKTPFEQFISAPFYPYHTNEEYFYEGTSNQKEPWDQNRLLDCKITSLVRANRIAEAYETAKRVPDEYWQQEPYKQYLHSDPFVVNIWNKHDSLQNLRIYNKRTFLRRMVELDNRFKKSNDAEEKAKVSFMLANAWYNMSWHGKYWLMSNRWKCMADLETDEQAWFRKEFMGAERARQYYLQALSYTQSVELASISCLMAGHIVKLNQNLDKKNGYYGWITLPGKKNPYLPLLKRKFSQGYYLDLQSNCDTYNQHVQAYASNYLGLWGR